MSYHFKRLDASQQQLMAKAPAGDHAILSRIADQQKMWNQAQKTLAGLQRRQDDWQ
jgi:hypothetical protein